MLLYQPHPSFFLYLNIHTSCTILCPVVLWAYSVVHMSLSLLPFTFSGWIMLALWNSESHVETATGRLIEHENNSPA